MALSFEESKKLLAKQAATPMMMAMPAVSNEPGVMTLESSNESGQIAAYSEWTKSNKYDWYDEYNDTNISRIDNNKNITVHESQINISQEENSQFIPFEMSRYYDGFDLMNTEIWIHYLSNDSYHGSSRAINVSYDTSTIKFGWLVDGQATHMAGNLKFEIRAIGINSNGNAYVWKSKTFDKMNVLESLINDNDSIVLDDSWVQQLITKVTEDIATKIADVQVGEQVVAAQTAAARAEAAADNAESIVDNKLVDYSTTTEMQALITQEIANADIEGKLTAYAKTEDVEALIGDLGVNEDGSDKTVKQYIDAIDVSEQLEDYALKSEIPTVPENISAFNNDAGYATKTYVDEAVSNVQVDLSGYATTSDLNAVETSLEAVLGNTVTNATNIATVQNNIAAIQSSLNALEGDNKNLIVQYDEVGSVLHLYERNENGDIIITDGDEQIKVKEISSTVITGAGGGGGGSLVSTVKLSVRPDGADSSTILYGSDAFLNYKLSTRKAKETQDEQGNDVTVYEEAVIAGDITLTLYRNNVYITHFTVKKTSSEVQSGSIDISDYIILDDQVFTVVATYVEQLGSGGESITVRSQGADWAIKAVNLGINLDDRYLPGNAWETELKYGNATFSYTPIGDLEKTIYFKIDNEPPKTIVTSLNGISSTYPIPKQAHGVHTFQVWCEANVGGTVIPTEPYKYVLMFVDGEEPIIRIKAPTTYSYVDGNWIEEIKLEQYSSADIYFNVYDPLNAIIKYVEIYDEDGVILSSRENITSAQQKYEFKPSVAKDKTITIKYKEYSASVSIKVTKFPYQISAITDGLIVDFVPTGRANSDIDYKVFKNNAYTVETDASTGEEVRKEIPMTWEFSKNFDWVNGGWKTDENGDAYFCIKAGTYVDINYNLFGTDGVIAKKDANGEYTIAGTGKEFKLIFKTTNVAQANTTWLTCEDIADKKSLGIRMEAQNAYIDSGLGTLEVPYVDDDIIEFDMNIVPITEFLEDGSPNLKVKAIPMIMTYEDGTPVQPIVISSASMNFKQDTPKPITIGSAYCDVHIYRLKVYESYLTDRQIIDNFIADARSGVDMAHRYIKNEIYPIEDKQKITPESVAAACPDLKVYVLSASHFTNDKDDKVSNTTIRQIHNTGTKEKPEYDISENWTATGATHNGQGTSSNEYGYSGRNLEFDLQKATITLGDNTTVVTEIQLSPTSYPTNYLNFKINIASSENSNNALLQKRYDRYLPYTTVASLLDDRKKNSMEFFNCVVFIQETDTTIANHREFGDTNVHFYGIGNIGDSKKTDNTRVNDKDDTKEFCVEIMDWNRYLSSFPADTMVSTLYINEDGDQVVRFENLLVDENLGEDGIIYEKDGSGNYYHSTDDTVDKSKVYYIDILENDDFSEKHTYGFRYVQKKWKEKDSANYKELNEEFQRPLRQKWIDFYRFVTRDLTTNGVEDAAKVAAWKSEFSNWFILDAALYYYLYTLRYTMVDNRAKNTFWHWGKHYLTLEEALAKGIKVYDENGNEITDTSNPPSSFYDVNKNQITNINAAAAAINDGYRMDFWDYDNDTALGIDNAGKLEIPFGVEDDDTDFDGVPYFRANDSTVFQRIAKYFVDELENMWHNTEINPVGKAFDSTGFINEFDEWQDEFPEELWRLDYERKYKRTYVGGTGEQWDNALPQSNKSDIVSTRFLTEMMNGRKKYQRRCFERNQEIYMSSKFKGEVNLGDTITLRGTGRPTGKVVPPNFTLKVTPFSKMYVNLYSATDKIYHHEKYEAGTEISVPYPETTLDFIYIRGASQMQSLGDLSPMYLQTAELVAGAKLKTITLGNKTEGYSNDSLKTLQIGAGNKLLEELDIRNLSNLNNTVLPVSSIPSLKRVYAQGSNISEAVFANNGLLEEAYLPGTVTRLELRNLHYLKTVQLGLNNENNNNLLHLVVMNCSAVMNGRALEMINQAPDLKTLRVTNIDWRFDNVETLERLYGLIKTPSSPEVVIAGKVFVNVIGTHDYNKYKDVWPDLNIDFATRKPQYKVTFLNYDGSELDVQYVEQYQSAVDPIERAESPIATPVKPSTAQYNYIYTGWDNSLASIDADRIIMATYIESLRSYTVQYVSKGTPIQTTTGFYGDSIVYDGEIPTYDEEEPYTFYLFDGWDKSGYVDGDKIINAVFDSCAYKGGYFDGKDFSTLRPVELYMMMKLSKSNVIKLTDYVSAADSLSLSLGSDFSYSDSEKVLISEKTEFNGSNCVDTGINLLAEDKDFVLAIDYKMGNSNAMNAILAGCFFDYETSGFKLYYNGGTRIACGDASDSPARNNYSREMIVIRHIKGENGIHVYSSNTSGSSSYYAELSGSHSMMHNMSLVFGCGKGIEGYERYATGTVYWSKLWYEDLGDAVCTQLACWPHEEVSFKVCCEDTGDMKRYYISKGGGSTSSITFVATNALSQPQQMNTSNVNSGGWANSALNKYLNNRLYQAFPVQWRQLMKQVEVKSSIGNKSTTTSNSDCYIFVPSISEMGMNTGLTPYSEEGTQISHFTDNSSRICYTNDGAAVPYWTRSPSIGTSSSWPYFYSIDNTGTDRQVTTADSTGIYVRIMIAM